MLKNAYMGLLFVLIFVVSFTAFSHCQNLMPIPQQQFFTSNGTPLSLGFVYTYKTGTSTPLVSYTDVTGNTVNSNPILLNTGGFPTCSGVQCSIWLQTGALYRIVVQNSAHVQQYVIDGVVANGANNSGVVIVDGVQAANIAAGIAALPAVGGTVILPAHYRETLTSHVDLGGGSGVSSILIVGGPDAVITCDVRDGSYCFGIRTNSGIEGYEPWSNTGGSLQIVGSTTMAVANMVKNLELPQASIVLEKVWISSTAAAPPSNACLLLDSVGNMAIVRDLTIVCKGAIGWEIESTSGFTGPFTMDNVWSLPGTTTPPAGTIPCKILNTGGSIVGIVILGGACNDAYTGLPSLWIDGNGHLGATRGINIENYDEVLCANTGSTAIQLTDVQAVQIHGTTSACNGTGGTNIHGVGISESVPGYTREVLIEASQFQQFGGGCSIHNTISGECGPANINTQQNVGFYKYSGNSGLTPTVFIGGSDFRIYNSNGSGTCPGAGCNPEMVLSNAAMTVTPPLAVNVMNQNNASQWAALSACTTSAKTVTFPTAYNSPPIVLVSDITTSGGAKVTSVSASQFVVACVGASDAFSWLSVGNPN